MATHTSRPDAPPPPPPPVAPEARGPAVPTLVGVGLLVLGVLGGFATAVGYSLANGHLSAWDRLSEGSSFGVPSSLMALATVVCLVAGLVLLGVGIGSARRGRR